MNSEAEIAGKLLVGEKSSERTRLLSGSSPRYGQSAATAYTALPEWGILDQAELSIRETSSIWLVYQLFRSADISRPRAAFNICRWS